MRFFAEGQGGVELRSKISRLEELAGHIAGEVELLCVQTMEVMCLDSPMSVVRGIEYIQAFWRTVISIGSDDAFEHSGEASAFHHEVG
jgi:hypothetical protein